jgi:hypothetical protein
MPDAALIQITSAIKAQLEAAEDANIFADRDDAEPIQESERPAKVIRCTDVVLDEYMEQGLSSQLHEATFDIDHYADADSSDNLNTQLSNMIAATVPLLAEDNWSLGGKVFEFVFLSVTANADDVPDAGVAILTFKVKFLTPLGDWTTIIPFA